MRAVHFDFPNNAAIGYGCAICDKVARGESYGSIMIEVKAGRVVRLKGFEPICESYCSASGAPIA
jgi:hypothetical protein